MGGKIISGQFEKTLKVVRCSDDELTATVEVTGIPSNCFKTASASATVIDYELVYAAKINQYGKISRAEEERHLNDFVAKLEEKQYLLGIVHFKNDRSLVSRLNWIKSQLVKKGISENRIIFALSDDKNKETELWTAPKFIETDCENCLLIKAQELDKLQKVFKKI